MQSFYLNHVQMKIYPWIHSSIEVTNYTRICSISYNSTDHQPKKTTLDSCPTLAICKHWAFLYLSISLCKNSISFPLCMVQRVMFCIHNKLLDILCIRKQNILYFYFEDALRMTERKRLPEQYRAGISEMKFKPSSLTGEIYLLLDVTANELTVQYEFN